MVLLVRRAAKGKISVNLTLIELRFFLNLIRSVFQKCIVFEITELFMLVINKYRSFYKNNHFNFRII